MNEDELIQYYVERLVYQYRGKPKARATIAILVKQLIADGLLKSIEDGFWLDRAIGEQLDILGKYVGLPRNIGPSADKDYFGFHDYVVGQPDNDNGFRDYTDPTVNATGEWYSYTTKQLLKTEVSDSVYSPMIRLKALLNTWDGTLADAVAMLNTWFGYAGAQSGATGNLIQNPDFRNGTLGWGVSTFNNTTLPVALSLTTSAPPGRNAFRATVTGTPAVGTHWSAGPQDDLVMVAPGTYSFRLRAQCTGVASMRGAAYLVSESGAVTQVTLTEPVLGEDAVASGEEGDFVALSGTFSVPEGYVSAFVVAVAYAAGGVASPWIAVLDAAIEAGSDLLAPSAVVVDTTAATGNACYTMPEASGTTGWAPYDNNSALPHYFDALSYPAGVSGWGTYRMGLTGTIATPYNASWGFASSASPLTVTPGEHLATTVAVQGEGIYQAGVQVVYTTAGGTFVALSEGATAAVPATSDPANEDEYLTLSGVSTVPAGAERAYLRVFAVAATGTTDPILRAIRPGLWKTTTLGVSPKWVPGLDTPTDGYTWYIVRGDLGLDPTTLIPYLPRKVGTAVRLTYSKPGLAAVDYTSP